MSFRKFRMLPKLWLHGERCFHPGFFCTSEIRYLVLSIPKSKHVAKESGPTLVPSVQRLAVCTSKSSTWHIYGYRGKSYAVRFLDHMICIATAINVKRLCPAAPSEPDDGLRSLFMAPTERIMLFLGRFAIPGSIPPETI